MITATAIATAEHPPHAYVAKARHTVVLVRHGHTHAVMVGTSTLSARQLFEEWRITRRHLSVEPPMQPFVAWLKTQGFRSFGWHEIEFKGGPLFSSNEAA